MFKSSSPSPPSSYQQPISPPSMITAATTFVKITAFSLLSFSFLFLCKYFYLYSTSTTTAQNDQLSFYSPTTAVAVPSAAPPPPLPRPVVERTGIINEMGIMTDDFIVGEFDEALLRSVVVNVNSSSEEEKSDSDVGKVVKYEKFRVCDESMMNYIPCLDNNLEAVARSNSSAKGEKYERHCPESGKGLDCVVPRPKGYKLHIPWPKSRDEVWFDNVPHTRLAEDKRGKNWISRKGDKFIFPEDGTRFIHGADQYLDQISKMVPEIAFGQHTRVVLDIGSGFASFGVYLTERNVTTLSIAQKDVLEDQIQLTLERGVPAMVAAFGTCCLPYPSQAFDLIHCSSCRINWIRDGMPLSYLFLLFCLSFPVIH